MKIEITEELFNRVLEYLGKQPLAETYQLFTELLLAKQNAAQPAKKEEKDGVRTKTDK